MRISDWSSDVCSSDLAAALVAERKEPGAAAVAPRLAAEIYGLTLCAENIEDSDDNMTRFVILSKSANGGRIDGPAMTTFLFEVKNVPAALYKAMGGFATRSEEHTSELQSLMRISYAVFCLKKKKTYT